MTGFESGVEFASTGKQVFLAIGFLSGLLFSLYLHLKLKKTPPKIIGLQTGQGIQRLYRIGQLYYTKEDYDKNLDARKAYGEI